MLDGFENFSFENHNELIFNEDQSGGDEEDDDDIFSNFNNFTCKQTKYETNTTLNLEDDLNFKIIKTKASLINFDLTRTSFLFIKKENIIRKSCIAILNHKFFYHYIHFLIILSIFRISLNSFFNSNKSYAIYMYYVAIFINSGFLIEAFVKIISFGVIFHKNAYFKDYFNIFDFIILIVGLLEILFWKNNDLLSDLEVNINFNKLQIIN